MINKTQALDALSRHIGHDKGIAAAQLAADLGTTVRHVRHLVTELRLEGIAVCGTPAEGYYIAQTAEEVEATCAFLRQRAMHSLQLESRLRKIPLVDLLGQLHLAT